MACAKISLTISNLSTESPSTHVNKNRRVLPCFPNRILQTSVTGFGFRNGNACTQFEGEEFDFNHRAAAKKSKRSANEQSRYSGAIPGIGVEARVARADSLLRRNYLYQQQ